MADTYHKIYLQFIFAVKYRESLIPGQHKTDLHKYITGLVRNRNSKMLAIHCMPDHLHMLVGFNPGSMMISDFVKEIKVESNKFVNEQTWMRRKFRWQNGYGVFSYSRSQVDRMVKYILNQEEHHRKKSFKQEYLRLLKLFDVEFKEKYIFEFIGDKKSI
jgi:putative transposase